MKHIIILLGLLVLFGCTNKEDAQINNPYSVTPEAFATLKRAALETKVQNFSIDATQNSLITTANGVFFTIHGNCLSKNGNPVTGMVDVQVVELFERGAMLTTNKPTMGALPNGDKALLISGGEFFLSIFQDGEPVDEDCDMVATIPANLTGGVDTEMTLFKGNGGDQDCDTIDDDCDGITWQEITDPNGDQIEVAIQNGDGGENFYVAPFGDFGWTNIDRFYTDARPKTTLLVAVPSNFNSENSAVYLAYVGEPNALAALDTFNANTNTFSEHYGQIPIGLQCHVIFTSEANGQWLYAIKSVTIADGETISIMETDLSAASESVLETLINELP